MYFSIYFFFMNNLNFFKWLFFFILTYIFTATSYAAAENELAKSQENLNIITKFFTTDLLLNLVFALIVIIATFILSKIVSTKVWYYMENTDSWESSNREELVGVITRTTNITILAIGFTITLSILWIDIWIFMAWLWLWIWFTLKIFLSNFISWIIMVTQWTYHNWDIIEIWWKVWKITKVHSLFTAVEQFDWVIYYVPNIKFLEENVSNFHSNDKRRIDIEIGVDYKTDIVKAKKIMIQVVSQFPNVLKAPEPSIFVDKFDSSAINLSIRFWIDSKDEYFQTKSNVMETINLAFKQSNITIPFPQITISNRSDMKLDK